MIGHMILVAVFWLEERSAAPLGTVHVQPDKASLHSAKETTALYWPRLSR
jgi:hypothetical protein